MLLLIKLFLMKCRLFLAVGCVAVFVVTVTSSHLYAGLYKWVDEQGVTHFSDSPPNTKSSMDDDRKYSILDEDTYTTTDMFVVKNVPEDIFNGKYLPIRRFGNGCIMAFKKTEANDKRVYLKAVGWGNDWSWRLSLGGTDYYETEDMDQSLFPAKFTQWHSLLNKGGWSRFDIQRKSISAKHDSGVYIYYRNVCDIPTQIYPWVKYEFEVTNAECPEFNGVYTPYITNKSDVAAPWYSKEGKYFIRRTFNTRTRSYRWMISGRTCSNVSFKTKDKNLFPDNIACWDISERKALSRLVYTDAPRFEEPEDKPYGISITRMLHERCGNR